MAMPTSMPASSFRAFIAVDIAGLVDLSGVLGAAADIDGKIKVVEGENVHLTLKFLGDTDRGLIDGISGAMREAVEGVAPFDIVLKGAGAFPNRGRPRVLWVGVEGADDMKDIARRLNYKLSPLGFEKDRRGFSPHLTVARVRFTNDRAGLRRFFDAFEGVTLGTVRVDRVRLKESVLGPRGPTYSTVVEVALVEGSDE